MILYLRGNFMNTKEATCFVIMPISDPPEYEEGHFKCVYEDIIKKAIEDAGYTPKRADDDLSSKMIHVDIIRNIVEAPMAICDLSNHNPNVLFELGIRQAFDLPVVLIQECGTPRIFDIATINTIDYRKDLFYREVLEDREKIRSAILETAQDKRGINSIIKLININNAQMNKLISTTESNIDVMFYSIMKDVSEIKTQLTYFKNESKDKNYEVLEDNIISQIERLQHELEHDNMHANLLDTIERANKVKKQILESSFSPEAKALLLARLNRTLNSNENG